MGRRPMRSEMRPQIGAKMNCMNENDAMMHAEDDPVNDRMLFNGVKRAEQVIGIQRQERQDDAEAEQVDEDDEENDEHRLVACTGFRIGRGQIGFGGLQLRHRNLSLAGSRLRLSARSTKPQAAAF